MAWVLSFYACPGSHTFRTAVTWFLACCPASAQPLGIRATTCRFTTPALLPLAMIAVLGWEVGGDRGKQLSTGLEIPPGTASSVEWISVLFAAYQRY